MARPYHFVTEIRLTAPPELVWDTLAATETWPSWWRWLKAVRLLSPGDPDGMGRRVRNRVATPLRYRLTYEGVVVRAERPGYLELSVSGDLSGAGRLLLSGDGDGGSELAFHWLVRTRKLWMRVLGPVVKPGFVWSHRVLMTDFADGLAHATGSKLVAVEHRYRPSVP